MAKVYEITKGMEVSCRQLTKNTKLIRLPMRVLEACTAGSVFELIIHRTNVILKYRKCNKQGHIAKMCCKQLPAKSNQDVIKCIEEAKYIEQDTEGLTSESPMELGLFTIEAVTNQSNG